MIFLDHTIVLVRNLDSAEHQYTRLGFTLTPRGGHPTLGTANHTVMLGTDYFELLAVLERSSSNSRWAQTLERREGFAGMALGTNDARAERDTLIGRGFDLPPVIDFARPVTLPSGVVEARFTVAHLPPDASPALPAFFCQQHTREFVWRPEWQQHPNSAFGIAGMTVVHPDPEAAAPGYERLLGRARVHPHPGGLALSLGRTRLWLVNPAYAAARLGAGAVADPSDIQPLGFSVLVRDLDAARNHLRGEGIPFRTFGSRSILVAPDWTAGVQLELLAADRSMAR